MSVPYENRLKIKGFLRHRHPGDYFYLLGIYAGLAVPPHSHLIEPSELGSADSVRVELSTAESILWICAVINPVAEATDIVPNLVSAASETPKLL